MFLIKKIKSILEASPFKNHHLLQLSLDEKKQLAKKHMGYRPLNPFRFKA